MTHAFNFLSSCLLAAGAVLLASCGGGGSGSASGPEIEFSISTNSVSVNTTASLSWSALNATGCEASGAWSGERGTQGEFNFTPANGGQYRFTLRCTGEGGRATRSVDLTVPMPVFPTSYQNAKWIELDNPSLPTPQVVGLANATFFHAAFAFADFFQEGTYSAFVQMPRHDDPGYGTGTPEWPAQLLFLRRDGVGRWVDATSTLLTDRTGCITPRKSLVVDFNQDGKPDVFVACHGYDGAPGAGKPLLAEHQRLLLSRPDGRYDNLEVPVVAYGHGGAAADLNGDGLPDVVLTNTIRWGNGPYDNPSVATDGEPFVLINEGNGQFSIDTARLPTEFATRAIYSLELIDLTSDGEVDLLVGATAPGATDDTLHAYPNSVFDNDGAGRFPVEGRRVLPNVEAPSGRMYGIAGDFVFRDGALYVTQVDADYSSQLVQRVDLATMTGTTVFENSEPLVDGLLGSQAYTFDWLYPAPEGRFKAQMATCPENPGPRSICSVSFLGQ